MGDSLTTYDLTCVSDSFQAQNAVQVKFMASVRADMDSKEALVQEKEEQSVELQTSLRLLEVELFLCLNFKLVLIFNLTIMLSKKSLQCDLQSES